MLFKDALNNVSGFRVMLDWVNIRSAAGRRALYNLPFITDAAELEAEYDLLEKVMFSIWPDTMVDVYNIPDFDLSMVRDIQGTLNHLADNHVLGDIELFEVKDFVFAAMNTSEEMVKRGLRIFRMPDILPVMELLDPERQGVPQFYVYDAYSADLAEVRKDMRKETDESLLEGLRSWEIRLEDEVRAQLSEQLRAYHDVLQDSLNKLAKLDVLVGKAEFARLCFMVRPTIRKTSTSYRELSNIDMAFGLGSNHYQSLDVDIKPLATVVVGSNMAGKSVLLKTLEQAQYLAQFGFFVSAWDVSVVLVDEVILCMGDEQDQQRGLSSFAAEMFNIDKIIQAVKAGKKVLALIDEPARTTNPTEGRAIVNALVDFLSRNKVLSVVTTHYDGITARCRRLRVRGFNEEQMLHKLKEGAISANNINLGMDYSLVEDVDGEVPQEALRIAELLGIDPVLVDKAKVYLKKG